MYTPSNKWTDKDRFKAIAAISLKMRQAANQRNLHSAKVLHDWGEKIGTLAASNAATIEANRNDLLEGLDEIFSTFDELTTGPFLVRLNKADYFLA